MTRRKYKKFKPYSISKKLREENKSNDYFELLLGQISLEDIIALKLEVAYRSLGTVVSGFPIWRMLDNIIKESVLKFGVSISEDQGELSRFLGIDMSRAFILSRKYKTVENLISKKQEDGI